MGDSKRIDIKAGMKTTLAALSASNGYNYNYDNDRIFIGHVSSDKIIGLLQKNNPVLYILTGESNYIPLTNGQYTSGIHKQKDGFLLGVGFYVKGSMNADDPKELDDQVENVIKDIVDGVLNTPQLGVSAVINTYLMRVGGVDTHLSENIGEGSVIFAVKYDFTKGAF